VPLSGDPSAALNFLSWVRPAGPWVLTAIPPEGGVTQTRTFGPETSVDMLDWVAGLNGKLNVYWMVNPSRGVLTSKAKKEDVESVEFLHVDLDPAKPTATDLDAILKHVTAERVRILALLEGFTPVPSAIVDSGGGYQAFWRLDEPIVVAGTLALAVDAEAYNQQLGILLGGDATHNADRVMRLPGTLNVPDEKKRKKGRTERLATVIRATDVSYPLSTFTAAPRIQNAGGSGVGAPQVQISGNLPFLKDLDELPDRVANRTRMLIVQGDDPDDPTKYGSRSDVVWAVTCALVRDGVTDDMIAAVLLDPDFGISAHVRAQKRSTEYVARQIQRAREECEEPMLRMMNEAHAVIADLGGKCRIISEVMDTSLKRPRSRISKQSFEDFRNRYMHIPVQVGTTKDGAPIWMPSGKWWLQHKMRRQYGSLVFAPRREVPDAYNLWQGFACEALPGDAHQPFLDHVRDNICSGDEEHYRYVLCWMARAVQLPDEQGEVAIVLRGGRGTGKGTFVNGFGSLWGRHFMQVSSAKHIVGQFNAHLRDCVILFADEAFFAGDKQNQNILNTMITEDTLVVEGKGVDAEIAPNYTHLLMASNQHWVVPAGGDERRYLVLDVGDAAKQDTKYFGLVRKALDAGGRENLLHYLMNLDIGEYDVRRVPQTDALREQKLYSLSPEEAWFMERLMDGRTTAASPDWVTVVQKERVQADYLRYCEDQRHFHRVSPTALGKFLSRVMPKGELKSTQRTMDVEKTDRDGMVTVVRERTYVYEIPQLDACRAAWDERYGGPFDWPVDTEDESPRDKSRDAPY
jgi:hypothetical protein